MLLPFVLLGLSICSVWVPPVPVSPRLALPAWLPLFVPAIGVGIAVGILQWQAVASLALLAVLAWSANKLPATGLKVAATVIAMAVALALALHLVPGFRNPQVVPPTRLGADSPPFVLYANFDKGSVGLLLLALMVPRVRDMRDLRRVAAAAFIAAAITSAVVMAIAAALGYVHWDPKWPAFAPTFLAINLLFTCVAEEAFFRGVIQDRLARACERFPRLTWLPLLVSALLFGVAHAGGGALLIVLATIAGFGYALAYARTKNIEAAVLTHFAVNAVHFLGFSYPSIAR